MTLNDFIIHILVDRMAREIMHDPTIFLRYVIFIYCHKLLFKAALEKIGILALEPRVTYQTKALEPIWIVIANKACKT
jgi:hypothetical protein